MANKPSYATAYKLQKAGQPGGSISVEGAVDATKPEPHTESLIPPKKAGMPDTGISPEPKAGPGWQKETRPAIAHPGETKQPDDVVKT